MKQLWALCLVGAVAACSSHVASQDAIEAGAPTLAVGQRCIINRDCSSPFICGFGRCHVACESSRDCEPGQRCESGDRPNHVCQLAEERQCAFNSDCPVGQRCAPDKQCRDQCATTQDCLLGQVCVGGACADETELVDGRIIGTPIVEAGPDPGGLPCNYTSECPLPLSCRNNVCAIECLMQTDCASGNDCLNNRCVVSGGRRLDAGAADSGD